MNEPQWVAWRRVGGQKWWPVAETTTEKEAWDEIWKWSDRDRVGTFDYAVLKVGLRPNC